VLLVLNKGLIIYNIYLIGFLMIALIFSALLVACGFLFWCAAKIKGAAIARKRRNFK